MKLKIALVTTVVLLMVGCTEKFSNDKFLSQPPEAYQSLMNTGWSDFSSGDYAGAYAAFSTAAEREATLPEVYLGLGWSATRNLDLEEGQTFLGSAISFAFLDPLKGDSIIVASKAGLAGIALATGEYQDARDYVDEVLSADPNFAFSHDTRVNKAALKKIKATAAYYQGDFAEAFQQVLDLELTISGVTYVDPAGAMNAVVHATNTTGFDGIANVTVASGQQLVLVTSAVSANATYEIYSIDEGTNTFAVYGNPALHSDDPLSVKYYYTTDFGKFLSDLLAIID